MKNFNIGIITGVAILVSLLTIMTVHQGFWGASAKLGVLCVFWGLTGVFGYFIRGLREDSTRGVFAGLLVAVLWVAAGMLGLFSLSITVLAVFGY